MSFFGPMPVVLFPNALVQVQHELKPRNAKHGLPETFKVLEDTLFPVVKYKLMPYMVEILKLKNPNMDAVTFAKNFSSLYTSDRAFSNKHGSNSGDFKVENLITGGATLRLVNGKPFRKRGYWYYSVWAVNVFNPIIPSTLDTLDMTINFLPTISTTEKQLDASGKWTGLYRKTSFPQFDGNSVIPFWGKDGKNSIRADYVKHFEGSVIPSPFIL